MSDSLQDLQPSQEEVGQQERLSPYFEQATEIAGYLQELTPHEIIPALEVRAKLNQLGLLIGPDCMDGWKWFPNTWPSKDSEGKGRDTLRMILDASYKFLPKELQQWFHVNWCFNPIRLDGAEAGIGPPSAEDLTAISDKQIILGLIASNTFDFHVELASQTLKPKEKENFIQYWLQLKGLVTKLGIKPVNITDHLGFLDSKNIKAALAEQHPYNFDQILLSSPHRKAKMAFAQAMEQIDRLKARGSKYLTIHGGPQLDTLDAKAFERLRVRLKVLTQEAEQRGVYICLETQGENKAQIDALLTTIPQLKITWDIAHVYLEDQKFNKPKEPQTHLTNEDFFAYLAQGKIAMLHLGQPTADETKAEFCPRDSHYPLFHPKGLIPQEFLKRMFRAVYAHNNDPGYTDKVHLTFESPLKLEDYDKIFQHIESP